MVQNKLIKKLILIETSCAIMLAIVACSEKEAFHDSIVAPIKTAAVQTTATSLTPTISSENDLGGNIQTSEKSSLIDPSGQTIETRILPPKGFKRSKVNDYGMFLRNQALLPDGSPVLLFDGREKHNQTDHVAVLAIDVGERDRQQCADAALRLRCEYLFESKQFDKISYHLTNGDEFPYTKYREGFRLKVNGNRTELKKSASKDSSYETFQKYLQILFAYAGTISVEKESKPIVLDDIQIGDIFVIGGSPGHCVIVMDLCENDQGEKAFLLGQSYMPAQQIHILKNPGNEQPWYFLSEVSFPFHTPEWTFARECLKRMP